LVDDHRAIAQAVKNNQPERAVEIVTVHLARLDDTIERISEINGNYFQREA
jgi:DNA-binding GntR family transcriptional regulator